MNVPSVISKDECLYCFETVYNEALKEAGALHSLNLCLSCFQPVCHRHLPLHVQVSEKNCDTAHWQYLNIHKVKRTKVDEDQDMNKSNKKIRLNVVEKSEDEMFETNWSLLKYNSSTASSEESVSNKDPEINPVVQEKIKQILGSKSQDMVDKTSSWELSVKSCPHTQNFQVPAVEAKSKDERCNDCGLDQNLWLCLHCGNIGCGREQVGIEGHSHALNHYDKHSTHPLAVKLGSLSQSSIDLYCYSCNDEVKFENPEAFAQALSKYGIDLKSKLASEKSLVELQVEQNMNWDFQMTDAQGKELKHLSANKEYGCGLINLGNSCYINSVLQCLLNGGVKTYSLSALGESFPLDVLYPSTNMKCQLIKLNNAIKLEPELYPSGIRPRSFKKCIGQAHEEFSSERQQDALEFLSFFNDTLDKKIFSRSENNPSDLMRFIIENRLQCTKCGKVKYTTDINESMLVPLEENSDSQHSQSLLDRLVEYFHGEELDFKCPQCKDMVQAIRKPGFKTFPDTLVVNPVRIKLQNWTPVKTADDLIIPGLEDPLDTLDLSKFQSSGFNSETESPFPEEEDSHDAEFVPNQACVSQLAEMGFSPNAITRSLHATGNLETEPAMNWLFAHMEDPDINEPFTPPKAKEADVQIDQEAISSMTAMGLDAKLCKKALILNNGDVTSSVDWVFNNMDDDGELPQKDTQPAKSHTANLGHSSASPYKLVAVVCHKGNSAHSGHYVAFIRKSVEQEEKWVLYNDEKIVVAVEDNFEEIRKNGYLYFYSRV